MNRIYFSLGLAGIVSSFIYWYSHGNIEGRERVETVNFSQREQDQLVKNEVGKKTVVLPNFPLEKEWERDEFRNHIDVYLEIIPPGLYAADENGCKNIGELRAEHTEIILGLFIRSILNPEEKSAGRTGGISPITDRLIEIDAIVAHCLYNDNYKKYREALLEMATHLIAGEENANVGALMYSLGEEEKAREYFKKDFYSTEELIKLTPSERLSGIRDEFIEGGRYMQAGKIEWYMGNEEQARELIMKARETGEALEEAIEYLQEGEYRSAIGRLWGEKIPFYRELVQYLCVDNQQCLQELDNYVPFENTTEGTD